MPSCVVKICKNNSTAKKKSQGITFHRFPKDNEPWKKDWIEILRNSRGENEWMPSSTSVICSAHFDDEDFYFTKMGRRRVITFANPKKLLFVTQTIKVEIEEEELDEPNNSNSSGDSTSIIKPVTSYDQQSSFQPSGSLIFEVPAMNVKQSSSFNPAVSPITPSHSPPRSAVKEAASTDFEQPSSLNPPASTRESSPENSPISGTSPTASLDQLPLFEGSLREALIKQQKINIQQTHHIKILNQKILRLQDRNKSLKGTLKQVWSDVQQYAPEAYTCVQKNLDTVSTETH